MMPNGNGAALKTEPKTDPAPKAGDTIDGRFVVERILGGGRRRGSTAIAGTLVRAWDKATRSTVAVRIAPRDIDSRAFALRAEARATFVHPALAKVVAFGASGSSGPSFIATEWVEGEDLGRVSRKSALPLTAALAVVRRIADGVLIMNRRGAAHGGVSLEHVIVPGGDLERAKLVGLERALYTDRRSARAVEDVQEDVYGLALLLYGALGGELLTGTSRIAPLRRLRGDLPAVLDELFARALSHDPARRPEDVAALLAELEAVELVARGGKEDGLRAEATRLVTVVAGRAAGIGALRMQELRELATSAGGEIESASDGTLVVSFPDQMDMAGSSATPAAASRGARGAAERAARCAIGLRTFEPSMAIVTSTACVTDSASSGGSAITRARAALASAVVGAVSLDDVTARLIEGRFEVHGDNDGIRLHRERERGSEPPPVLRGTPFVGRERENGILDATLTECIDERVARAVVLRGEAGIGKTRLVQEFVRRVRARALGTPCEVWRALGDPRRSASPLGLIAQLVRASAGVVEGEAARAREIKLKARAQRHLVADHVGWVSEGLAELAGTDGAGRVDLADAWTTYASAEALVHPLVIVVEDVQWADSESLVLLDRLIAQVKNVPLMIVITERDEAGATARGSSFGDLRAATHVSLGDLPRRAMEKLVTHLVGEGAPSTRVGALVDEAAGNPRALIDTVRDGDTARPHGQSHLAHRLARLSDGARRLLASGSVFGLTFWPGVASRMSSSSSRLLAAHALDELVREELVHEASRARFPGEPEFVFRDAELLAFAYSALTDEERAEAHGHAARWLEEAGECDAQFLAEHHRRAGSPERAASLQARANQRAGRVQSGK